ncbi:hypothetical protein SSABA_v1c08120 [Spiroplasma sabaudiense Ar-1343]|uniref:Uncharacterized protein n=1 Tax=Spiroplasma sabaudiense Ar-1343 TaxID=1276257 RepID=W6AB51_9MOLU|nr:hypothetical protein [Spiroplasma sabaudiense]AHI54211.1 hypothetical protein SSABA_v1c08120 [Spiroplasma sabaudiense Ar-1343]
MNNKTNQSTSLSNSERKSSDNNLRRENYNSNNSQNRRKINLKTMAIDDVIDALVNTHSRKQFFGLLGNQDEVGNQIFAIKSGAGPMDVISIEAKKVFLYSAPFSFLLKQIINHLPLVKIEDKKVLWERISILLSALNYGKGDSDYCFDFEESLDFDDPLEAIRLEFNDVFQAYNYRRPLVILVKDFRGLQFDDVNKMVSFVTTVFERVTNIKVLIEINPSLITSHYQNYIGDYIKNWYTLFDGLVDCRNLLYPSELDQNETMFFEHFDNFNETGYILDDVEEENFFNEAPKLAVCPPKPRVKEDELAREIANQLVQETVELPQNNYAQQKHNFEPVRNSYIKPQQVQQPQPKMDPQPITPIKEKNKPITELLNVKIPNFGSTQTIEIPTQRINEFITKKAKAEKKAEREQKKFESERVIYDDPTIRENTELDLGPLFGHYTPEPVIEEEVVEEPKVVRSSFLRRSDGVDETIFDPEILMDANSNSNARPGVFNPFERKK